jgi:tetratricopeptide (TPR) repeat protein
VGWAWYVVTMLPVIGIVQVGYQGMADRYTYFTQIGLCLVVVYAVLELVRRGVIGSRAVIVGSVVVALLLMGLTFRQVRTWRDLDTLMDHALAVTTDNPKAYFGKGLAYSIRGEHEQALVYLEQALRIAPHYREVQQQIETVKERMRLERMQGGGRPPSR